MRCVSVHFPCKPKHVGKTSLILKCFNNPTFFNVVCISWTIEVFDDVLYIVFIPAF